MNNTRNQKGITHFTIVKILKSFSPKEINEFEKLLNSSFFNNHSTVATLFEELKKYYPDFSDKKVTKEYLFHIVNKGKKYDDKLLRKYLSRINKLAEEYLNILCLRSEKGRKELNILTQLSKRDINEVYSKKLKEVEKSFENEYKIDGDNFFLKHQFNTIRYNHEVSGKNIKSKNEDLVESYNNLVNYFLFFSSSLLNQLDSNQYSFSSSDSSNPFKIILDFNKIEEYIEEIKMFKTSENKDRIFFLEIILNDMKMNSSGYGLTAFQNLKALVYDNSAKLSDSMLYYLLQRMTVFCILESAKGNLDMNRDVFENYKMLLDKNLFNIEKTAGMTLLDFRLILSSALKNNEFVWVENFLNEKVNLIKEEFRINVRHHGNAMLSFYKKNYPDALAHISKIKSESSPITVDIYILKTKIFYALGHFDSAIAVADSFRHYITGDKFISDFHKNTLLNFLKYFKLILRLTVKPDKFKLKNLLEELQNLKNTKERKWMIEKTEELLSVNA